VRRIASLAGLVLAAAGSPAFASDVCERVRAFETAPFADGSPSHTVLLRWLVDDDGPVVACTLADGPGRDLCDGLMAHLSREFGHPLAIRLLECHGYSIPGVVLDRDSLPLLARFVLDDGRRVTIETTMVPGADSIRLTVTAPPNPAG
jgi:hypothetical protein